MSDTCPVCGKGDSEQFFAGYEDEEEVWGGRYVSHLACVAQANETMRVAVEAHGRLEAELATLNKMLMTLFMEERDSASDRGQDFFMPSDLWLADLRARAEEGSDHDPS